MADEEAVQAQPSAEEQRNVLNMRFERAQTSYANLAVLASTPEEIVINFAVNVAPPTAEHQVNVEISNRIVMSYPSAKRLAIALGNVIQRYENARGVIPVQPPAAEA